MATREKRTSRFSQLKTYFDMSRQGLLTDEQVKTHIKFAKENNGIVIFPSEFEKFAEEYKDEIAEGKFTLEQFLVFCNTNGAIKKTNSKTSDSSGSDRKRLNTPEAGLERGVPPEHIDVYLAAVNAIYDGVKLINSLVKGARVSFAIPMIKEKEVVKEEVANP